MSTKFLIVGLGNIGTEYEHTRHNIGFDIVDWLAAQQNVVFTVDKLASVSRFKFKGREFILIKPSTFMNLSGKAVHYWMQKEKIILENILVITDDIALPLGKIRMRTKGSDGGHNGLKNIQEVLQTPNYARLRVGIGNEFAKGKQADFVLGKWNEEEKESVSLIIKKSCEAVVSYAWVGAEKTMNLYNTK